jgi:hypothetical protein
MIARTEWFGKGIYPAVKAPLYNPPWYERLIDKIAYILFSI